VPLLESQSAAARVAAEFKLTEAPYRIAASSLIGEVITVRPVPAAGVIRIIARIDDPNMAADLANRFAAEAIEVVRRAGRDEVAAVEQALQPILGESASRLEHAERAYDDFRRSARLELLTKEIETLLEQRADLMKVTVELAAARAGLDLVEREVQKRQPLTALRQNLSESPALTEAARGSTTSSRELLGLEMRREEANPVFEALDEKAATSRAEVASLERQRTQLLAGVSEKELGRLSELYQRESTLARLDLERKLARTAYEGAATRYQGARVAVLGRVPQLVVVDPALPPDRPLSRYLARNVVLGLFVGTLFGAIAVLVRQSLRAPS
jgi:polysaccharide biosynthesis transport protein